MSLSDKESVSRVLRHLVEVSSNSLTLTHDAIQREPNEEMRLLLTGIVMLSNELKDSSIEIEETSDTLRAIARQKENERILQVAAEASSGGMLMVDEAGTIAFVNKKCAELFGYEVSELAGQSAEMLLTQKSKLRDPNLRTPFMRSSTAPGPASERRLFGRRKNGSVLPIEIKLNPIEIDGKPYALSSVVDITGRLESQEMEKSLVAERASAQLSRIMAEDLRELNAELRRTQARLIQTSKLNALGELAAGIAHELNQPLTVIGGLTGIVQKQLAKNKPVDPSALAHRLEIIQQETARMADIVSNIRDFARESRGSREVLHFYKPIERALGLVNQQLRAEGIQVDYPFWDKEILVSADPQVFQQVVINLLINAKDALLDLGRGEKKAIQMSLRAQGESAVFLLEDSGPGISELVQPKIFDPFFTTKNVGEGAGLGLSIVYGIVKNLGGTIRAFKSSLGGAAFEISLPLEDESNLKVEHLLEVQNSANSDTCGDTLRVAVVEDDSLVRRVVSGILESFGCTVVSFEDGRAALERLTKDIEFDLVITDFKMPGIDGTNLITELRMAGVTIPVVVMTAGRTEQMLNQALEAGAMACIEKPLHDETIVDLLERVSRAKNEGTVCV